MQPDVGATEGFMFNLVVTHIQRKKVTWAFNFFYDSKKKRKRKKEKECSDYKNSKYKYIIIQNKLKIESAHHAR